MSPNFGFENQRDKVWMDKFAGFPFAKCAYKVAADTHLVEAKGKPMGGSGGGFSVAPDMALVRLCFSRAGERENEKNPQIINSAMLQSC